LIKKLLIVLALLSSSIVSAHADVPQSIVVIDGGTNTSLFKDSIVYEVCVLTLFKCPNGKTTMEGTGAANLPPTTDVNFNHGTEMISVILQVNPTVKIIPIRIVGMTQSGTQWMYSLDDVRNALNWVVANREKYNIVAVSLSQGRIYAGCKVPTGLSQNITTLKSAQVPVMAAVGNDADHTAVFSPACLPDTVAVGATDNPWPGMETTPYDKNAAPYIARYSNGAQGQTDFFLNARYITTQLNGSTKFTVGTSNSTAALAAWWVLNKKSSFDETFNSIMATTVDAKNEFITGRYVRLP
jgi:hypothetical protein